MHWLKLCLPCLHLKFGGSENLLDVLMQGAILKNLRFADNQKCYFSYEIIIAKLTTLVLFQ